MYSHSYVHRAHDGKTFELAYLYPPHLAALFAVLSILEVQSLKLLWCALSFLSVVGSILLLHSLFRDVSPYKIPYFSSLALIAALVVCFEPVYWGLMMGQVDALVLLLLCVYALSLISERDYLAGATLSVAALLKISPVLLILWPLFSGRKKLLFSFVCSTAALSVLFILFFGYQSLVNFLVAFPNISRGSSFGEFVFNYSSISSVLELFALRRESEYYSVLQWVLRVLLLVSMFSMLWRERGKPSTDQKTKALRLIGILICYMLLLSPILWFHHFLWLLIPITVLLCEKVEGDEPRYRHWTVCAAFVFGATQVNLMHYQIMVHAPALLFVSSLIPTLVLLTLIIVLNKRLVSQ